MVQWRRKTKSTFEFINKYVAAHLGGRQLVLLITGFEKPDVWLQEVWGELVVTAAEDRVKTVVVSTFSVPDEIAFPVSFLGEQARGIGAISHLLGSPEDFARELTELQGSVAHADPIELPCRPKGPDGARFVQLSNAQYALISADSHIVHRYAAENEALNGSILDRSSADFFLGNEISWYELSVRLDVARDIAPALTTEIVHALREGRTGAIAVHHAPGAGGTTLARRVAWDMRLEFPTVIIDRFSDTVQHRMAELFAACNNLPLFIVLERGSINRSQRDSIFRELKGRHVRFFMLEVERVANPATQFRLPRTMSTLEARRFQRTYSSALVDQFGRAALASVETQIEQPARKATRASDFGNRIKNRLDVLKNLTDSRSYENYRSPFFYGFFAFETEFKRVSEFVDYCVSGLSTAAAEGILRASIISKCTERFVPIYFLKPLFGVAPSDDPPFELI